MVSSFHSSRKSRSGQAMIFIIMIVVILTSFALWNFDLHKVVYIKNISQNAGDSSALAGARWQAITLNLIGDLNVMQAVALTRGETNEAAAINELQARLCYVGPIVGLVAAQQAAKNNGIFNNEAYAARLRKHAEEVLDYRALGGDGRMMFTEPYSNAWTEYSAMIESVAEGGVAVGPDNARLYTDYSGEHYLLMPEFYDAVAGTDWCWFFHNAHDLLNSYVDYHSWPALPEIILNPNPVNSEYFGLGLRIQSLIGDARGLTQLNQAREDRGLSTQLIGTNVETQVTHWYCFDAGVWGPWDSISPGGENSFPAAGPVKPQYDYAGADAATRVLAESPRLTPGAGNNKISWTAAAKPFGYLTVNGVAVPPNDYGLVLPAFRDVRLIPIDASSAPAGGAFNLDWRDHIEMHLPGYTDDSGFYHPGYMAAGETVDGCWYCLQLVVWENPVFRQTGIDWLRDNSDSCQLHGRSGGPGGGSRRGH
ncbi:MAG: hypothetical protein WCS52_01685 [bacterium]